MGVVTLVICSAVGLLDYINPAVSSSTSKLGFFILAIVLVLFFAILVGFLLWKYFFIGTLILGFATGFCIGSLLYNLVFLAWWKSQVVLGISTFGLAAVGVILAWFFSEQLLIFSTSFIGSYFLVRGISMFVGGFPNEVTLY